MSRVAVAFCRLRALLCASVLLCTFAAPALAGPLRAAAATDAPASECERVVQHVTTVMKRVLPRLPAAVREKMKADLAAQPTPKKACADAPAFQPGVAACFLGATRMRGIIRCKKEFGGKR